MLRYRNDNRRNSLTDDRIAGTAGSAHVPDERLLPVVGRQNGDLAGRVTCTSSIHDHAGQVAGVTVTSYATQLGGEGVMEEDGLRYSLCISLTS